MKMIKRALFAVAGVITIMAPLSLGAVAHALPPVLSCSNGDAIVSQDEQQICDLAVDKQVSVNGGAFAEADTSPDAAQAHVGDTITWKITVTNNSSEGLTPHGAVYIYDLLPGAGVSYVSSSATAGNYITSGFFANYWYLPLLVDNGDGGFVTSLPATLTITSTSTSTGVFQNTAALAKYDPGSCDGGCTYVDGDPSNDSNDAWIDPSAKPQVLADTTTASSGQVLADTGSASSTIVSMIAATIIVSTIAVTFIGRTKRI